MLGSISVSMDSSGQLATYCTALSATHFKGSEFGTNLHSYLSSKDICRTD